jgi:hypothetical protein
LYPATLAHRQDLPTDFSGTSKINQNAIPPQGCDPGDLLGSFYNKDCQWFTDGGSGFTLL